MIDSKMNEENILDDFIDPEPSLTTFDYIGILIVMIVGLPVILFYFLIKDIKKSLTKEKQGINKDSSL